MAVQVARHYGAGGSVERARPKSFLTGSKITVVFLEGVGNAVGDRLSYSVEAQAVPDSLSVAGAASLPFRRAIQQMAEPGANHRRGERYGTKRVLEIALEAHPFGKAGWLSRL